MCAGRLEKLWARVLSNVLFVMNTKLRKQRHRRVRARLHGTAQRPRVCVAKSLVRMSAQLIDDDAHQTLAAAYGSAQEVGKSIGEQAQKMGVTEAVFDRGGYRYHGKVKMVAESIRETGLKI